MRQYCYVWQYQPIRTLANLMHIRLPQLRPVDSVQDLRGCDDTDVFVYIDNHAQPVPYEILEMARERGMLRIIMSDEWARSKHQAEQPAPILEPRDE